MKVGNIEVNREGANVKVVLTTGMNWTFTFVNCQGSPYHAELAMRDIYNGLREGRKGLQREILEAMRRHGMPGAKRGKVMRRIEEIYGL